jgi:hypothetical protein
MSIIAGAALAEWRRSLRGRLPSLMRPLVLVRPVVANPIIIGAVLSTVLMVGARAGGWPPDWERLPGPFLVDAYERGIDGQGVAAGYYARNLDAGRRIGCDNSGCVLASSYGGLDPVGYVSKLYTDTTWSLADEQLTKQDVVELLWVDMRMSEQVPVADGAYFPFDPNVGRYTRPIPTAALTKFDGLPGVDRLYDNGNIRIYYMGNQ